MDSTLILLKQENDQLKALLGQWQARVLELEARSKYPQSEKKSEYDFTPYHNADAKIQEKLMSFQEQIINEIKEETSCFGRKKIIVCLDTLFLLFMPQNGPTIEIQKELFQKLDTWIRGTYYATISYFHPRSENERRQQIQEGEDEFFHNFRECKMGERIHRILINLLPPPAK